VADPEGNSGHAPSSLAVEWLLAPTKK